MIFKPELAKRILAAEKTMTRRPVKPSDHKYGKLVCRYEAGKSYAIQPGRGKPSVGRLTVTSVRLERVGLITYRDARLEGFKNVPEFLDYWQRLYAPGWKPYDHAGAGDRVLRHERRLRQQQKQDGGPIDRHRTHMDAMRHEEKRRRSHEAHKPDLGPWPALACTLVWVITFKLGDHVDRPRLLARTPGETGDYTTQPSLAMSGSMDPGEALHDAEYMVLSDEAKWRDEIRRLEKTSQKNIADRIKQLEKKATAGDPNAQKHLFVITDRLDRADRQEAA